MGESENHGRRAFFIQAAVSPPCVLFGCDDSIKAGVKYLDGEFDLKKISYETQTGKFKRSLSDAAFCQFISNM